MSNSIKTFKNGAILSDDNSMVDAYIDLLLAEQARQLALLEVIASETNLATAQITLADYQEGYGSGYSVCSCDADIESFSYSSLQLDEPWVGESTGKRFSESSTYPYGDVRCDTLLTDIRAMPYSAHAIMASHLYLQTNDRLIDGLYSAERLALLDIAIVQINQTYNIILAGKPPAMPASLYTGVDINSIRNYYLVLVDYIVNSIDNMYYCSTGDNPVVWDEVTQWSMLHESGGGWSRCTPETEEDWDVRNNLDVCDIGDINNSEAPIGDSLDSIKSEKDRIAEKQRGYDYTRRLAREKIDRECRYESYLACLSNARSLHGLHVHMLAIEVAYKRSLWVCERKGGFSKAGLVSILITRKQLDSLRGVYHTGLAKYKGQHLQRRTQYLGYAVALHQSDKALGNIKASVRIMQAFRSINRQSIGPKYYSNLVDIKNRMFRFILRNIKKAEPKQKIVVSQPDDYQQYLNAMLIGRI